MREQLRLNELVDIVGFADPSSGKLTTDGAQNAIVIVGQDEQGIAYVLDEWAERASSDVLTSKIYEYNRRWRCKRFGLDSTGQQNLYYQAVLKEAYGRRERLTLVPVDFKSNTTKEFRITVTIQKWMHNSLLYVNDACKGTLRQLERYPTGTLVDIVDALAAALDMLRYPIASRAELVYDKDWEQSSEEKFYETLRKARGPRTIAVRH